VTAPPTDPRVRGFLDALAEAVAEDLLRELRAEGGDDQVPETPRDAA
jgi:hypothetical protein